jgi:hypothetical protein
MNTKERTQALKDSGIINLLSNLREAKYIQYLDNDDLGECFPVYTARNYKTQTIEYKAALLLDCHFAAKSKVTEVSQQYLRRFVYVLNQYQTNQ